MNDRSMITKEQKDILAKTFIGTLSTIRHKDGLISSNPVSYIWNGTDIEISTLQERVKYKNLLANPRATLCVIAPDNHMRYVEIRGTVTLVDDSDKTYFKRQFRELAGEDPPEDLDPPGAKRAVIYLHPEQVSSPVLYGGRFDE